MVRLSRRCQCSPEPPPGCSTGSWQCQPEWVQFLQVFFKVQVPRACQAPGRPASSPPPAAPPQPDSEPQLSLPVPVSSLGGCQWRLLTLNQGTTGDQQAAAEKSTNWPLVPSCSIGDSVNLTVTVVPSGLPPPNLVPVSNIGTELISESLPVATLSLKA